MVIGMTEKQKAMLWKVTHSKNESLYDVYKTFSHAKHLAFDNCIYEMRLKDGFNFRITSATPNFFCCGFLYYDDDKHLRCRYYTGRNTYEFIVE